MGKATGFAVALLCVCLWATALNWTHTIVGAVYLNKYAPDWKGECSFIWAYDVLAVIYTGVSGLTALAAAFWCALYALEHIEVNARNMTSKNRLGGVAIAVSLLIWGAIILANISTECRSNYENNAPELWTLFLVSFVYAVANVALICCCIPVLAAFILSLQPPENAIRV